MHPKIDIQKFSENSLKIIERYQTLLNKMFQNESLLNNKSLFDPTEINRSFIEIFSKLYTDPTKMLELQTEYVKQSINLVNYGLRKLSGENPDPVFEPYDRDKRFKDDSWNSNLFFDLIKQTYLMNASWISNLLETIHIEDKTKLRANFFIKQVINALSPSNFVTTNPLVLKETIASSGENLLKGMDNFIEDIESSKQIFDIRRINPDSFTVGKNIACTKGKVVYQNEMMQLIYYTPTTKEAYEIPLLVIPPWINKYYIMDLTEKDSFVKWILDQGFSVFLISWVNPDAKLAKKSFDDYMQQGSIAAIDFIKKVTKAKQVNILGYCLGGTLTCMTEAYLQSNNDNSIKSASLLATLLDFSNAGEILAFIDDQQLKKVEEKMSEDGYYDGDFMSSTFSLLRSNDMIWSFFINNYLLGKEPLPFDILYWNADSTRLPAKMHSFYLRNMYLQNNLAKSNGISLCGTSIDLKKINKPCYFLAAIDDHIAPWEAVYKANKLIQGPIRFVLSGSGHVAGVVNPPSLNKYCFWTNDSIKEPTSAEWFKHAKQQKGSWWTDWAAWIKTYSGEERAAITQESLAKYHIENAPGSYVLVK